MKIIENGNPELVDCKWWAGKIGQCNQCGCKVELEEHDKPIWINTWNEKVNGLAKKTFHCVHPGCSGAIVVVKEENENYL